MVRESIYDMGMRLYYESPIFIPIIIAIYSSYKEWTATKRSMIVFPLILHIIPSHNTLINIHVHVYVYLLRVASLPLLPYYMYMYLLRVASIPLFTCTCTY